MSPLLPIVTYADARAAKDCACAEIVRPVEDTDDGSRELGARDPRGALWSVGTYEPVAGGGV